MAANIEFNSQKNSYSFYSLKEVPWHSLGTVVEEAKTPDEIIHIANMDYQVDLAPMFASFIPNGAKHVIQENDHFACHMSDGNVINIPKKELVLIAYLLHIVLIIMIFLVLLVIDTSLFRILKQWSLFIRFVKVKW